MFAKYRQKHILRPYLLPENLRSAFKKSGVYPYDPTALDQSKLTPSKVYEYVEKEQAASITCISSQPLQTVHEESEQPVGIVHEESPPSSPLLVRNNGNEQFESFDDEKAIEFFSARPITTKQTQVKKGNISTLLFQAKL